MKITCPKCITVQVTDKAANQLVCGNCNTTIRIIKQASDESQHEETSTIKRKKTTVKRKSKSSNQNKFILLGVSIIAMITVAGVIYFIVTMTPSGSNSSNKVELYRDPDSLVKTVKQFEKESMEVTVAIEQDKERVEDLRRKAKQFAKSISLYNNAVTLRVADGFTVEPKTENNKSRLEKSDNVTLSQENKAIKEYTLCQVMLYEMKAPVTAADMETFITPKPDAKELSNVKKKDLVQLPFEKGVCLHIQYEGDFATDDMRDTIRTHYSKCAVRFDSAPNLLLLVFARNNRGQSTNELCVAMALSAVCNSK